MPRGLGAVATSGWGGVEFLSNSRSNVVFDLVVGVSSAGSLRHYAINRSTGAVTGGGLTPSGWGQITHLSVGPCLSGPGAMVVGIHSSGRLYGYYDANASDFSAADLTGLGPIGVGFTGRVFD